MPRHLAPAGVPRNTRDGTMTELPETLANPSLEALRAVHDASSDLVRETPTMTSRSLSRDVGGEIVLKAENLQRTGSFKIRGALAKLRSIDVGSCAGVVTGSAGNHAQSLAYAARSLGIPCRVYMPQAAAIGKVEAVRAFGGEVVRGGEAVDSCVNLARDVALEEGMEFVHPFDDADVIAGQSGVGVELAGQVPDLRRVVVPVGGGGLASGIAIALKLHDPEIEVIGVQAEGCAAAVESMDVHHPVEIEQASTIADGIAVKRPGNLTLPLLERWLDGIVTVDDEAIVGAMVRLAERTKLVTEGAGAVGVAALLTGAVEPAPSGATVAVLSGGNVDPRLLAAAINRHEITESRRVRIRPAFPTAPAASPICSRRSPSPAPTSSRSPTSATSPTSTSRRPRSTSPSRPAAPTTPPSSAPRGCGRLRGGGGLAGEIEWARLRRGVAGFTPRVAGRSVPPGPRLRPCSSPGTRPPRRGCEHAIPRPDDGPPDAGRPREPGQPPEPPQVMTSTHALLVLSRGAAPDRGGSAVPCVEGASVRGRVELDAGVRARDVCERRIGGHERDVENLRQCQVCGVVGAQRVAELPDPIEERFVRVLRQVEVDEIVDCDPGAIDGQITVTNEAP